MILGITPLKLGEGLKDKITETTFIKIIAVVMALLLAVVIIRLITVKKNSSMFNWVTIPMGALPASTASTATPWFRARTQATAESTSPRRSR